MVSKNSPDVPKYTDVLTVLTILIEIASIEYKKKKDKLKLVIRKTLIILLIIRGGGGG
jgi:hypothetical protein